MATVAAINSLGKYTHNPRGNLWYNDESTYGHQLLSKMGWSKGKGLGKNEDGIRENIKVKFKMTNSGVGWNDKSFADIKSTEYDSLLNSFNENNSKIGNTSTSSKRNGSVSLVELSQSFKNRLHYSKFVKAKDISQYSEKDMKAIFLYDTSSKKVNDTQEDQLKPTSEKLLENSLETYTSNLSVSDYFAKKMKEKKAKLLNQISSDNPSLHQNCSNSKNIEKNYLSVATDQSMFLDKKGKEISESSASVGGLNFSSTCEEPAQPEVTMHKKKRKRSLEDVIKKEDISNYDSPDLNSTCEELSQPKATMHTKKRKKSLEDVVKKEDISNSDNPGLNFTCEELSQSKATMHKKKRKKSLEDVIKKEDISISENPGLNFTCKELSQPKTTMHTKKKFLENVIKKEDTSNRHINCERFSCSKKKKAKVNKSTSETSVELYGENTKSQEGGIMATTFVNDQQQIDSALENGSNEKLPTTDNKNAFSTPRKNFKAAVHVKKEKISDDLISEDVSDKRRKKKKTVHVYECSSTEFEKNSDILNEDYSSYSDKIVESQSTNNVIKHKKKQKKDKHKQKLKKKLKKLKSCLKTALLKSTKNVSFNDSISYRIFNDNSFFDHNEQLISGNEKESNSNDPVNESYSDDEVLIKEIKADGQNDNATEMEKTNIQKESEEGISLAALPSTKSSHFNLWIDSQKQALKMEVYKNMLKNVNKHDVLRTTNLLSIKGYGNWGF